MAFEHLKFFKASFRTKNGHLHVGFMNSADHERHEGTTGKLLIFTKEKDKHFLCFYLNLVKFRLGRRGRKL